MESVILTEKDLEEAVSYILQQDAFAFDIEASGQYRGVPHLGNICWLSLATKGYSCAIPFGHPIGDKIIGEQKVPVVYKTGKKAGQTYYTTAPEYEPAPEQLSRETVFRIVAPLFQSGLVKIGHDMVYDLVGVAQDSCLGFIPAGPYHDTKITLWLLNENNYVYGLKQDIEHRYEYRYDFEGVGACVESYPFSKVAQYSFCDARYAYYVDRDIFPEIDRQGLTPVFELEMEVLGVMVKMRQIGARVDTARLESLHDELTILAAEQEAKVYELVGRKFNIGSNKQKVDLFYGSRPEGGLGLKPWRLTKGGQKKKKDGSEITRYDYSTDKTALEAYKGHPVVDAVLEYTFTAKILGTFVDGWLGYGDNERMIYSDHIHAGFLQHGTVTGRFSCRSPNLQNLPRPYTPLGKAVRSVFIADPDGVMVVGDYSQIELVVLAHLVGYGALYDGFLSGIDPHTLTAAMVLGKSIDEVTKVERQDLGKTLGFAVTYGAGIGKISSMANVTPARAKEILKVHAKMFPEIHEYRDSIIAEARKNPDNHIRTLSGRKRRVPYLKARDEALRMGAERQLFNSVLQGGAADLIKLGLIETDKLLPSDVKITLTVHDEIVLTAPKFMEAEAIEMLRLGMTGPVVQSMLRVPVKADIHSVTNWADAK